MIVSDPVGRPQPSVASGASISAPSPHAITVTPPDGTIDCLYDPLPCNIPFHLSTVPNLLAHGPRGTGKSTLLRWDAIARCITAEHPFRALILRRTMGELRRSHLVELEAELKRLNAPYPKNEPLATYRQVDATVTFSNGSTLVFGHCEDMGDVLKYLSAQFDLIAFDELTTFPLDFFLRITGSARSSTTSGRTALVRAATNPLGPGASWVKEWFITRDVDPEEYPAYRALQFAGKVFLNLSPAELAKALQAGVVVEVYCGEQAH